MATAKTPPIPPITVNRRARHDYFIEQTFEAGIMLKGWEVKSLRAGQAQLKDGYVLLRENAAWLLNCHITPLKTVSTHITPEPLRTRKLLLNQSELNKLLGSVERKGYTIVPLQMYWKKGRAKVEIGLAKGKKEYDKRASIKEQDWKREKERLLRVK